MNNEQNTDTVVDKGVIVEIADNDYRTKSQCKQAVDLIMNLSPKAVIPVLTPDNPETPIGHFVVLEKNPVVLEDTDTVYPVTPSEKSEQQKLSEIHFDAAKTLPDADVWRPLNDKVAQGGFKHGEFVVLAAGNRHHDTGFGAKTAATAEAIVLRQLPNRSVGESELSPQAQVLASMVRDHQADKPDLKSPYMDVETFHKNLNPGLGHLVGSDPSHLGAPATIGNVPPPSSTMNDQSLSDSTPLQAIMAAREEQRAKDLEAGKPEYKITWGEGKTETQAAEAKIVVVDNDALAERLAQEPGIVVASQSEVEAAHEALLAQGKEVAVLAGGPNAGKSSDAKMLAAALGVAAGVGGGVPFGRMGGKFTGSKNYSKTPLSPMERMKMNMEINSHNAAVENKKTAKLEAKRLRKLRGQIASHAK